MRRSRKAIYSIDPNIAVSHLSTMNEVRDQLFIGDRFTMMLYVDFAFVALTLAAIGVYGVISFGVSRRTQGSTKAPTPNSSQRSSSKCTVIATLLFSTRKAPIV